MALVVFGSPMVKIMEYRLHDLTSFLLCLNNAPAVVRLKNIAERMNYHVEILTGNYEYKNRQLDEFISVSVNDINGNEVYVYDDGYMTIYEPIFIHSRNGECRQNTNWLNEILEDIAKMINYILSLCFLIKGMEIERGLFNCNLGLIEIQKAWKEKSSWYCIAQLNIVNGCSTFPKIGDELIINDKKGFIVSLAEF